MIKYFTGITFTFLLLLKIVSGQTVSTEIVAFEIYADSVLKSSESRWTDFPKCPPLTKDILTGLKRELSSDSVKFYFEKLKSMNVNHQIDYQSSMNYFIYLSTTQNLFREARIQPFMEIIFQTLPGILIC